MSKEKSPKKEMKKAPKNKGKALEVELKIGESKAQGKKKKK
jgi:hypothetical protein